MDLAGSGSFHGSLGELRALRDRLHAILQIVTDAVVVVDFTGALAFVNAPVCALLGIEPAEILGRPLDALYMHRRVVTEDGRPVAAADLPGKDAFAGACVEEVVVRLRDPASDDDDDDACVVLVRTTPIWDHERKVLALLQVFRDVSAEHRTHERLELIAAAPSAVDDILRLAAAHIADVCFVDVADDAHRPIVRRIAAAGSTQQLALIAAALPRELPAPAVSFAEQVSAIDVAALSALLGDEQCASALVATARVKTRVTVPIVTQHRTVGALTLLTRQERFDAADATFARAVAKMTAAALEHARLFEAEQRARVRATRLAKLTAALSRARTTSDVAEVSCRNGAEATSARSAALWTRADDGSLVLAGSWGVPAERADRHRRLAPEEEAPATLVVRTGEACWIETEEDYARATPELHASSKADGRLLSFAALPVRSDGTVFGVLVFCHPIDHRFSAEERELYELMAMHCAQALDRARLLDVERRASERLALLASASDVLSKSLDYEATAGQALALAIPLLADACVLELDDAEGTHRREIGDAVPAEGARLTIPVVSRNARLGAVVYARRPGRVKYSVDDIELAEELSNRIASAVDQARLYLAAQEANRLKDEFLATVSHELRTPLNAIAGWSSLLQNQLDDPTALARGLEVIRRNAHAQTRIVEDILDVARIMSGKMRIETKPVDLLLIAREAADVVRPTAESKKVALSLTSDSTPCFLVGDPERLRQVVWNLLANAVKFTEEGGVVTIHVGRDGAAACVTITDTGAGIPGDLLPYVFDRFRQGDGSTTRKHGGLGLGLAIVKHIVDLHGGAVTAESEGTGRGATFRVALPANDDALHDPQPSSPTADPARPLAGLRILAVDDEDDARDLLETVLGDAGAEVVAATNANDAFELLRAFRPDVLVSDIGLPGDDGYWLVKKVRALPRSEGGGVVAIAVTAHASVHDRVRALTAGFSNHVTKPLDPRELVAAIANLTALFVRR